MPKDSANTRAGCYSNNFTQNCSLKPTITNTTSTISLASSFHLTPSNFLVASPPSSDTTLWSQLLYQGPDGAAIRARQIACTDVQRQLQFARTRSLELHDRLLGLRQQMATKLKRQKKTKLCKMDSEQLETAHQESLQAAEAEEELAKHASFALFELRQALERRQKALAYGLNLHQSSAQRHRQLMKKLSEAGRKLPLYKNANQTLPQLVGAIPVADPTCYIAKVGDMVAAFTYCREDPGGGEEVTQPWAILGEVVRYDSALDRYEVDDIDNSECDNNTAPDRHILSRRKVVPLPKWRADPLLHPETIFPAGARVLALYPQTTCLYGAVVTSPPVTIEDPFYRLRFEDSTCPGGYAVDPPLEVCQRYVIAYPSI